MPTAAAPGLSMWCRRSDHAEAWRRALQASNIDDAIATAVHRGDLNRNGLAASDLISWWSKTLQPLLDQASNRRGSGPFNARQADVTDAPMAAEIARPAKRRSHRSCEQCGDLRPREALRRRVVKMHSKRVSLRLCEECFTLQRRASLVRLVLKIGMVAAAVFAVVALALVLGL